MVCRAGSHCVLAKCPKPDSPWPLLLSSMKWPWAATIRSQPLVSCQQQRIIESGNIPSWTDHQVQLLAPSSSTLEEDFPISKCWMLYAWVIKCNWQIPWAPFRKFLQSRVLPLPAEYQLHLKVKYCLVQFSVERSLAYFHQSQHKALQFTRTSRRAEFCF